MSRQYFDFSGLIRAHENRFTVVTQEARGYNDSGDFQEGQEKRITMTGAIIAFRESKVFRSDGAITAKDKRLFMRQALPDALVGAQVIFRGHLYKIESELENAEFTGVYSYLLKYVSAFDKKGGCV